MVNPTPEGGPRATSGHSAGRIRDSGLKTESKAAYKTTEFYVYLIVVILALIASLMIGASHGHNDYFRGDNTWFYVVLLSIGYLLSRGLAKSGSRESRNDR
jgi:F0F1-type ATP synthase assembly protein I